MHRKLAFSTLAHDTLGIIPLAAGVVTRLCTSTKNSVRELVDYTTYVQTFQTLTPWWRRRQFPTPVHIYQTTWHQIGWGQNQKHSCRQLSHWLFFISTNSVSLLPSMSATCHTYLACTSSHTWTLWTPTCWTGHHNVQLYWCFLWMRATLLSSTQIT